jgi:DNA-binding CsgD family transcriptional regulator
MSDQLSRAHRIALSADLAAISLKVDEAIGRNATNPITRSALRDIRESLDELQAKIDLLSKSSSLLTAREGEILAELKSGATAAAIARKFSVTEPTVKSHMAAIYRKLGVNNKTSALAEAVKRGLLTK